jgi:hypothetical protein
MLGNLAVSEYGARATTLRAIPLYPHGQRLASSKPEAAAKTPLHRGAEWGPWYQPLRASVRHYRGPTNRVEGPILRRPSRVGQGRRSPLIRGRPRRASGERGPLRRPRAAQSAGPPGVSGWPPRPTGGRGRAGEFPRAVRIPLQRAGGPVGPGPRAVEPRPAGHGPVGGGPCPETSGTRRPSIGTARRPPRPGSPGDLKGRTGALPGGDVRSIGRGSRIVPARLNWLCTPWEPAPLTGGHQPLVLLITEPATPPSPEHIHDVMQSTGWEGRADLGVAGPPSPHVLDLPGVRSRKRESAPDPRSPHRERPRARPPTFRPGASRRGSHARR